VTNSWRVTITLRSGRSGSMMYPDQYTAQPEFEAVVKSARTRYVGEGTGLSGPFIQLSSNGSRYAVNALDVESIDLGEVF
jgi:hypothetical protein